MTVATQAILAFSVSLHLSSQAPTRAPGTQHEIGFFTDTVVPLRDRADGNSGIVTMLATRTVLRVPESPATSAGFVRVTTLDGKSGWVEALRLQPIMSFARRGWISDSSTWQAWRRGPYCMEDTIPVGAHESCGVVESPSYRHFADGKDWILRDSLVY